MLILTLLIGFVIAAVGVGVIVFYETKNDYHKKVDNYRTTSLGGFNIQSTTSTAYTSTVERTTPTPARKAGDPYFSETPKPPVSKGLTTSKPPARKAAPKPTAKSRTSSTGRSSTGRSSSSRSSSTSDDSWLVSAAAASSYDSSPSYSSYDSGSSYSSSCDTSSSSSFDGGSCDSSGF